MNMSMMGKRCKECGEMKSVKDFGTHIHTKDGFQTICKECCRNKSIKAAEKAKIKQLLFKVDSCIGTDRPKHPKEATIHAIGFSTNTHKYCKCCKLVLPKTDFNKCAASPDGLQYNCKKCTYDKYKKKKKDGIVRTLAMKRCTSCNEMKKYSEFYRNKRNRDGLQYQCKECMHEKYFGIRKKLTGGVVIPTNDIKPNTIVTPKEFDINIMLMESMTIILDANSKALSEISERLKQVLELSKKK